MFSKISKNPQGEGGGRKEIFSSRGKGKFSSMFDQKSVRMGFRSVNGKGNSPWPLNRKGRDIGRSNSAAAAEES